MPGTDTRQLGADVSPARAGMDRRPARPSTSPTSFPRTRGDGPNVADTLYRLIAFPPHARGWTRVHPDLGTLRRGCFPRTRGDGPPLLSTWHLRQASRRFPRTRGDGPAWMEPIGTLRSDVSPARAGMDLLHAVDRHLRQRRFPPHARGWTAPCSRSVGSSGLGPFPPHARGWTARHAARSSFWVGCFPRTRGDGPSES